MIPDRNQSGVLPPFLSGASPTDESSTSPFSATMLELVKHFSTSQERIDILNGLLTYRSELRNIGINAGFQWIDGSFVEDVETIRGRPPKDVDIITFAYRPPQHAATWRNFVSSRFDLFHPDTSKKTYKCDAYFVDMTMPPEKLVRRTHYFFGLFSHQRDTYLWKGMLEIPLGDDTDAIDYLKNGGQNAS